MSTAAHETEALLDLGEPIDLPRTLGVLQRGVGDPSIRLDPGSAAMEGGPGGTPGAGAWLCQRVYAADGRQLGQASMRFDQLGPSSVRVRVAATGMEAVTDSGATADAEAVTDAAAVTDAEAVAQVLVRRAEQMLGSQDSWQDLELLLDALGDETSAALARVRRRHPGVRLPATGALFDQLVTATLEQKVTHDQARTGWRQLLRSHGEEPPSSSRVPAPEWMRLPLTGAQLRAVPSWEWHRLWVQPALSKTIQRVAERATRIHQLSAETGLETESVAELGQRLRSIPGIGEWTVAEALQRSHGAQDLPAVGDYHLSSFVGAALTGRRTDDGGMLRLLAPYAPHRQRIIRLLKLSGFHHQRYGPKLTPADHRSR
ncbi:DNA-3-methyladenine glycosylase family protein [Nesterenkonia lutea]|uniref:3-methyladenine DNA glycosylase/8-oxoguanine DNA glycosylase n=1 Tax=Nesterenkonia lutea TaxID=272919 RepID=A0ABR9JAQ1_9MICC|nr:3-methyladenine DNA glycosylase [Nesterenkonia lutea]MBE1523004.1 3-methyladenine DNA glycosylase/8-oxoguanine DNA glycosylase [Nesterenkonia lutea]